MSHLLSIVLVTPAVGALLILAMSERRFADMRLVAMAASILALAAVLASWLMFVPRGDQWQLTDRVALVPSAGISYFVGIDGTGLLFVLMASLAGAIGIAGSWNATTLRPKSFFAGALALQASATGVFVALNLAMLALCWIAAVLSLTVLVRSCGSSHAPRRVTAADAIAGLSGASILAGLAGLAILAVRGHAAAGIYTLDVGAFHTLALPPAAQTLPFLALLLAIAAPVAILVSFARGNASDSTPAGAPMIWLIAIGLSMSVFGVTRLLLPIFPDASRAFAPSLTIVFAIGGLASATLAFVQPNSGRVVAYAAIAEWCVVALALFARTPDSLTGALVQGFIVSLSAAALCLAAGNVMVLAIASLVFVAAPALAGLRLTVASMWTVDKPAAVVAVVGSVLIGAALGRLFARTLGAPRLDGGAGTVPGWRNALLAMALCAIAAAVALHPAPVVARLETSVARVVLRVSPQYAPQVSDCLTAAPPKVPENSGLPSGMLLAAPCETPKP